jgi:5-methyltetrahydrofolate--homocysteine methyltransferase
MIKSLEELLQSGNIIVLDGAMGTELDKRGFKGRGECNISAPEAVIQVHKDYLAAGATAIITNTLTMNRIFIESHKVDVDVAAVNRAGATLAREAVRGNGGHAYVLGNLSSTGQLLEPYGDIPEKAAQESFAEQARLLQEGGVDGFIIETMIDLREAACALKACKAVSSLPVFVGMAYETEKNGGRTVMGNSAAECVRILAAEGASAIGANCGSVDPLGMAEIVAALRQATRLPLMAEPNAGKPRLADGATVFEMDVATFASEVDECLKAGGQILGGCCGTTPAHIRALSAHVS